MNKVYAVMNALHDYRYERYGEPDLLRIFDSREKAVDYISEELGKLPYQYEYLPQNDTYECELDYGDFRVMFIEEHDVY